ncbi:MAG: DUF2062 domain-containing protein [Verrucomicrobiota bacterium]
MTGEELMESRPRSRWRRWLLDPVLAVLRQGMSAERVSWTIAIGIVLAVFPVVGTTTMLCVVVAWALGLNQALVQAFNWLLYPLHIALILVFIRLGERLYGAPPLRLSLPEMMARFEADPLKFFSDFGLAAWHGVSAWLLIAPFAVLLIKLVVTPLVRSLASSIRKRKEARP